jgi:hypothetical protein
MIQKKLHIPGEMERASLETDKSWREVSWWQKNIQVESHVESYVNLNGTDLGEVHFSQVSTIQIHIENCIDWTILRVTDWKLWVRWPQNQCESGIWNLLHRKQVVRLEDELAIMMMGSKDCCLSNFTLF